MNQDQLELRQHIEKFRLDQIEPFCEEDDANENFRMEIYKAIGEMGLAGIPISENYGGAGLKYEDFCYVLEELAKSSVSYAVTLSVSTMVQEIIELFGTEEQKNKFLPELTSGEGIGAFCLSESSSGSDAAALKTTAKEVEGGYEINGQKMWITSGGIAKTYLVMARTGEEGAKGISAFIVPSDTPGLSFGKKEKKMGWKVSPTREVVLEKCVVPKENILGNLGDGFKVAMKALDRGRITIGSIAVGLATRALDESVKYSLEREQFKKAIFDFQGIQFMLAEMATETMAARSLVKEAAVSFDAGENNQMLSAMAKLKSTDVAMKVTTDAVQILGGVGYTSEYPVERFMRDAKVLQIVEGTNQIQKVVISRNLKQKFS
ncbi:MAG: acyl-CoA dehydrogenase family protein [Bacteriovoracaceae bacterium]